VGVVEFGQGEETLGILVHLDVVDIGDPLKWAYDPFQGTEKDGFLYGRGTVDDKGAAIMSLYAMKALAQIVPEKEWKRKIWLIVGTSEEGHWSDMEHFKEQFPIPDFGFSPDGEFPIYHVEKGYADVVLRFSRHARSRLAKGLNVGETVLFLQAGDSPNTIPSRAEIQLVGGQKLTAHGVSSHSSTPEAAVNAITKLCEEVCKIEDFDFARFLVDYFSEGYQTKKIGIDDGADHWKDEFVGTTTAVPTVLRLDQGDVLVNVNIRQKAGTTKMDIEGAFSALAEEYAFSYEINEYLDPMIVSKELPFVKTMEEVHK
jgi:succinyl-diaminopimelate desuccinylase